MKKTDRYFYPAVFIFENDEIKITFPDLNIFTFGKTDVDSLLSARELLGNTLYELEENGAKIPNATSMSDFSTKENEQVVLIDVYMPSVRMANRNKSVNRTVSLPAWLNSLAVENKINFSQVLQDSLRALLLEKK